MLTVGAGFLGVFKYISGGVKVITEFFDVTQVVGEFFVKIGKFSEDRKFTQAEVDELIAHTALFKKEWDEVIAAIKALAVKK